MIEAIIIDDEPKAIELLENYCNRSSVILCIKSFRNPIEALQFIEQKTPQVIFLDINMPKLSGTQLAKLIPSNSHIIFTTAYPEYAVESYNLNATDYLLKPITYQRFFKAVDKVSIALKKETELKNKSTKPTIIVKSGYEKYQISIDDILYLEKDGNYMVYHTLKKKILARETVSAALERLPETFIQTHKSFIVSTTHIEVLKSKHVHIKGVKIPVSHRYKVNLEQKLS
ncbi:LytR/AlgR family response regulator transcription factor [Psychroserpens luteolus]|uniref:LytR/AlgR family response regulator transcription factor n=1 Tax=Psychroserpens luteolus TaxID=2855840 RepID=UPI001E4515B6|nr:LytTR family DNA-binding domain-containing protein [Psychroserpens luteolus]MCD2259201.1 LytTR family DNA-binding domain-containing protein [Psychroserpens luteolus]